MTKTTEDGPGDVERWTLDTGRRQLTRNGAAVELGDRAFDLLACLAATPGQLVPPAHLMQQVWPALNVGENNLHVHVLALRKLLGRDAIRNVRGRGYQLTVPLHLAAAAGAAARPANVAGQRSQGAPPLIGRAPELTMLLGLLRQHRSVTVTGTAGVGKTTLALAAAQALRDGPAEVRLVELAGLDEGVPVAESVATGLGVTLPALQAPLDELVDVLRTRALLLVLDNCEHRAVEARRLIQRLLHDAQGVRVLATCQLPLRHDAEHVLHLDGLALPPPGASATRVLSTPAVALFCARMATHTPHHQPDTEERLADVVAICQRLDGLPLALELAAARVPLLGLVGLRERVGQPLRLLAGGTRALPERHRSLQAALAWTHDLLSDAERRALRRLGVFAGSFSLPLARHVLADPGDADDASVQDLLHGLSDKSLLMPQPMAASVPADSVPRWRLLESTRAFALQQLRSQGELPVLRLRLADAMRAMFDRGAVPRSFEDGQQQWQARAPDIDNLREALDRLGAEPGQALRHIELAGASAWIWSRVGLRGEGLRRCRQALDRVDSDTPARLEAPLQLAWATQVRRRGAPGDLQAAARAATLFEQLGDRAGRFSALSVLATMQALEGLDADCMHTLDDLADSFDPAWGMVQWGSHQLTMGFCLGQLNRDEEMLAVAEQGMKYLQAAANDDALAAGWIPMAQAAWITGDREAALARSQIAVESARRTLASGRLGTALGDRAAFLVGLGRVAEALPLAREAVDLRMLDGTLGLMLDQLALLACARCRMREAAMALGRADVHHAGRRGRRERYLREPHERATAAVTAALSPLEWQVAHAQGTAMGDVEVARLTVAD